MSMSIPPGTWRIGRLGGVDLLIKPSIVLMGVVLVALFAPRFDDRSQSNPYALAAAFVIALYVSVLVHELAHVLHGIDEGVERLLDLARLALADESSRSRCTCSVARP